MAKETDENEVVDIKIGSNRIKIASKYLLVAAALLGLPITGTIVGTRFSKPVEATTPAQIQALSVETAPAFLRLDSDVKAHHKQQEKDEFAWATKEAQQDREIKNWVDAVQMLNVNLSQVNSKLEMLQPQLNQTTQDVRVLTADIKELLRRQQNSP